MKKFMKALAVVACAVLLVVATIAGTVAYLTDKASVENTFTAGKVDITLDEAKVTEYGVQNGDTRVDTNAYKLVPGRTYKKDPTIHVVEGSEECYIFFEIRSELGNAVTFNIDSSKWTKIDDTNVYYYNQVATAGDYVAFSEFTVSGTSDVSSLDEKTVNVIAYAVQTSTSFADAEAAWNATFATSGS